MSETDNKTKTPEEIKEEREKKMSQLKCEMYDIIRLQENLNSQFNQLQNVKIQKALELQKLEQS